MFTCSKAGSAGDPRPRDSERRSRKVERGQGNAPARAAEEPWPTRVDDAIGRRIRRLRQSGQEIAHLPPDAAAVLEAAGTKHENVDRRRPRPVGGIPGRPIAWSTGLRMTPRRSYMLHMYNLIQAAKRKSGPVAASCNCQAATRRDPSGRMARPEKSLQALEKAQNGPGHDGARFAPMLAAQRPGSCRLFVLRSLPHSCLLPRSA